MKKGTLQSLFLCPYRKYTLLNIFRNFTRSGKEFIMNGLLVILFLTNFFATIFVLIVVYYLLKIIGKIALFSFVNHIQKSNNQHQANNNRRREGEVTIESQRSGKSTYTPSEGEYVDFEEVD